MPKRDVQELSPASVERITRVIRSLTEDRIERGIDLGRPMHCDSCDTEKPAAGSAQYGAYNLCNDCLLDFTLSLASGRVDNVSEYMMRKTDDSDSVPPSDLAGQLDRSGVPVRPLPGRDKLMPSNEPC